jgi:hypothetical protein
MTLVSVRDTGLQHQDVNTHLFEGRKYPLILTPGQVRIGEDFSCFRDWFQANRRVLDCLLGHYGAVLLRDFPVTCAERFSELMAHYEEHRFGYLAGAVPRSAVTKGVYESTRLPPERKLPLHQEMAYNPDFPRKIAFHCEIAPDAGGETALCDMGDVYNEIPPELRQLFEASGVEYVRNFRDESNTPAIARQFFSSYHRSWQEAFDTNDRPSAEAVCREMGFVYEWEEDGSLTVRRLGPAVLTHSASGRKVWFNQVCAQHSNAITLGELHPMMQRYYGTRPARPYEIRFGNGVLIDFETIAPIYEVLDKFETSFPWHAGDVMLLDNVLMAHGRNPYKGSRKLNVAFAE